jgi:hypothetical protein
MTKPGNPVNPAKRGPDTLTDEKHGNAKGPQLEGNRRPDTDVARGSEPATRGASTRR